MRRCVRSVRRLACSTLSALALLAATGCLARPAADPPTPIPAATATPAVRPSVTPEPLVPTPTGQVTGSGTRSSAAAQTPSPERTAAPAATATSGEGGTASVRATEDAASRTPEEHPTARPVVTATEASPGGEVAEERGPAPSEEPVPQESAAAAAPPVNVPLPRGRERFGAGVALGTIGDYPAAQGLGLGWYLDWNVRLHPARPGGAEFWQMVRVFERAYRPDADTIRAVAQANPGSFWIIGNEPDVIWQDNTTPEAYAVLYHELYHLLKGADPTCRVVIGGVSQPTPLRIAYLERVLAAYEERFGEAMPVDVWNVHAFILREERGSWGVDIPPGVAADSGMLYEIDDHDDLTIFARQLRGFRRWMADHGQREKPLVVSEYGILMPPDYGFETPVVQAFMEATFDLFLTASDPVVGYPADGNRLVQWWCWYSLAAPEDYYPTGNLVDPATGALTPLGTSFAAYAVPGG